MRSFLVESYQGRADASQIEELSERARLAARHETARRLRVRYLSSVLVAEDETCFQLFEGPSAEAVSEVLRRAGITCDRIVEAATSVTRKRRRNYRGGTEVVEGATG